MLAKVSVWNHVAVAVVVVVLTLLAGFRVIGGGDDALIRPERFDAKQVTVWSPGGASGDDSVRIREVVDIDFGLAERRGYQRIVPNDFGAPTDVTASSPDADATVTVVQVGADTRIRIGDPAITFTGRHRYVLEYTLPDANVSSGVLALDIIGNDETLETRRYEVVLTGFDFDGTVCDTGPYGSFGGCELERDAANNQVTVIEPLAPGDGISVGGTITGFSELSPPPIPEPFADPPTGFSAFGLVMIPLGLAAAAAVFVWGRRYGSNEVAGGGGAADAAFGDLPVPGTAEVIADVGTYRVPDSRLAEMATIEFAPPRGLEPWHGAVLLRESVGDDSVSAWFSEMVARDAIVVAADGGDPTIRRGPETSRLSAVDRGHLARLFAGRDTVELGAYDEDFTAVWKSIKAEQRRFAGTAGWWSRGGPGSSGTSPAAVVSVVALVAVVALIGSIALRSESSAGWRVLASPAVALALGFVVPLLAAFAAYGGLFPARTATGSALTLRTESFRRFLAASEGRHVDWVWERGLVREYSAWAVALDAADAWKASIESSNIPDPQVAIGGPLLVYTAASSFRASHTTPSSSGGGGGGGGVGGGGGGGSSGSW